MTTHTGSAEFIQAREVTGGLTREVRQPIQQERSVISVHVDDADRLPDPVVLPRRLVLPVHLEVSRHAVTVSNGGAVTWLPVPYLQRQLPAYLPACLLTLDPSSLVCTSTRHCTLLKLIRQ